MRVHKYTSSFFNNNNDDENVFLKFMPVIYLQIIFQEKKLN